MELKVALTFALMCGGEWQAAERAAEAVSREQGWDVNVDRWAQRQVPDEAKPALILMARVGRAIREQQVTFSWSF